MAYKKFTLLILAFCLLVIVAACSSDEPTPTPAPTPAPTTPPTVEQKTTPTMAPAATPIQKVQAAQQTSPLSAPNSPLSAPSSAAPKPTTTEKTGAVIGQLVVKTAKGDKPVKNAIIGLAAVVPDKAGARVAGYDASTAPRTDLDDQGRFVLNDVPPGQYGIILDSVMSQYLLKDPKNLQNSLLINVKANQVTDLDKLVYETLPLQGYSK
ncbi:MAG: hypothetical protein U0350_30630 [Caldilineaceae bacterium]